MSSYSKTDVAQVFGDAFIKIVNYTDNQFNELCNLSNKNLDVLQGEIASMNDKFTFLLESMAALEKKMDECCSTSKQCSESSPEESESSPDVEIIKVVEPPHKDVVVKTEPGTIEVKVDLQDEESVKNAAVEPEKEKKEEEEEEEEIVLIEKMLKAHNGQGKKKYYVTDDEEREIYEILDDGEPGEEPIGKLKPHGKTFRAHYFKKNEKK